VTNAATHTVRCLGTGYFGANNEGTVINQGVLEADGTGGSPLLDLTLITNQGTVKLNASGWVYVFSNLTNTKTILQTGTGNLVIEYGATLTNKGTYNIQSDSGIQQAGNGAFVNTGTLEKIKGTGTTTIGCTLNNTGLVLVQSGTVNVSRAVTQVSGNTLTAGLWQVNSTSTVHATLNISSGSFTTIGSKATVTLSRSNATFTNLGSLAAILAGGRFNLQGGQSFSTAGPLSNSGSITLSPGSVLTVAGSLTEGSTSRLTLQMGTVSGVTTTGEVVSMSGTLSLGGTLVVTSTVIPPVGTSFMIADNMGSSAVVGTFAGLAEGGTFTVKVRSTTMTFQITYKGGDGNDVVITRIS
jgi:hypothetical protein